MERLVTYKGVVYPSQTDAMGHMNVQYYVAAFDQAIWHLLLHLGFSPDWIRERREGWADVRYVIEYKAEVAAGDLIEIDSTVRRVGTKSLTTFHRLLNPATMTLCAELEATTVFFDLSARRAKPIPQMLRVEAEKLVQS